MLGHKLAQVLAADFETIVAVRCDVANLPAPIPASRIAGGIDVNDTARLERLLDEYRPHAVLNAVGIVKQVIGAGDRAETIAVNALFPNVLAERCAKIGTRLIHYSTDCVFSGAQHSSRGANGYREADPPDARDLYGLGKYLGEPSGAGVLVVRSSIIGRELRGRVGLLEWFLGQHADTVNGYTRALFTGLPTLELARVTAMLLEDYPDLTGLWHIAADPISKYDLLCLFRNAFARRTVITPYDDFYCDRRLDGAQFAARSGWRAAPWLQLIEAMRDDCAARE